MLVEQHEQIQLLACNVLVLSSSADLAERLHTFFFFFDACIRQLQVSDLALETPFLGKNAQNFLKLGYLRGIAYVLAYEHKLRIHEYAPCEIKRAVTGYGGAPKDQVAHVLWQLFPHLPHNLKEDATDALAVALCAQWKNRLHVFFKNH